jgi:hypothetical protein
LNGFCKNEIGITIKLKIKKTLEYSIDIFIFQQTRHMKIDFLDITKNINNLKKNTKTKYAKIRRSRLRDSKAGLEEAG